MLITNRRGIFKEWSDDNVIPPGWYKHESVIEPAVETDDIDKLSKPKLIERLTAQGIKHKPNDRVDVLRDLLRGGSQPEAEPEPEMDARETVIAGLEAAGIMFDGEAPLEELTELLKGE